MPIKKYAGKGDVYLRDIADPKKKVKQIRWGDFLRIQREEDGFGEVKWGDATYWVDLDDCIDADERPLEVVFLDVGQGDGCLVVTPDDRIFIIDAGVGDNMCRFMKWRFRKIPEGFKFHAAIVTHPDMDHYLGFQDVLDNEDFEFEHLYHNGIAERSGDDPLGPHDGKYLTDIMETHEDAERIYGDPDAHSRMKYPALMHTALTSGRVGTVKMLSTEMGGGPSWVPGFSPSDNADLSIEVLGPISESEDGRPRLRWFAGRDKGKTKNGHSVLLRLRHGNFSLLFGGDLNRASEEFILRTYGEIGPDRPLGEAVEKARTRLRSDVMKTCHHGSSDVTDEFLTAVDALAYAVSSGDGESHAHPRPDLLGRLGRFGRSHAPLILCTELLRSTREKEDASVLRALRRLHKIIEKPETPEDRREEARKKREELENMLARRNVDVYGAITLRTDGTHLALSFKLEKPSGRKLWLTYWYEERPGSGFIPVDM